MGKENLFKRILGKKAELRNPRGIGERVIGRYPKRRLFGKNEELIITDSMTEDPYGIPQEWGNSIYVAAQHHNDNEAQRLIEEEGVV